MQEPNVLTMDNFHQTKVEVSVPTLPAWFWWVVGGFVLLLAVFVFLIARKKKAHKSLSERVDTLLREAQESQNDNQQLSREKQLLINTLSGYDSRYLPYKK